MVVLNKIERILNEMGFEVKRINNGNYDLLSIFLEEDEGFYNPEIIISGYAKNDEEIKTSLIQFYFELNKRNKTNISNELLKINKHLPYGNLNINENTIYFKYVSVFTDNSIDNNVILDILNVINYISQNYQDK